MFRKQKGHIIAALIGSGVGLALSAGEAQAQQKYFVYVGSQSDIGSSRGVYGWEWNPDTRSLRSIGLVAKGPNMQHIWVSPKGNNLYAINWQRVENEGFDDALEAFSIDTRTGGLTYLNRVSAKEKSSSLRSGVNQVVVDPTGRIAVCVNAAAGTLVGYRVFQDGRLSDPIFVDRHVGPAHKHFPHPLAPLAHGAAFSPDGKYLFVADLGLDRIYSYDVRNGSIIPSKVPFASMKASVGPRRLQVSPNGKFLYANHETDAAVSVFQINNGSLREVQTISAMPAGFVDSNTNAEVKISSDGGTLYVSNRGADTIAVFRIDRGTGKLSLLQQAPAFGRTPGNITIDPSGRFLFVSNSSTGNVEVLPINRISGELGSPVADLEVSQAGAIAFAAEYSSP